MNNRLKEIFQNVNDWLKFAEAKHAGLVVLNSGIIFGILTVYKDYKAHMPCICIMVVFIFIGLSILLTLISLFPNTINKVNIKDLPINPNLYFFGALSKLNENDLKNELLEIEPSYQFDKLDNDLINQIIVNASIATRKYKLFKYAVISTILGMSLPLIYIFVKTLFSLI